MDDIVVLKMVNEVAFVKMEEHIVENVAMAPIKRKELGQ